MDTQGKANVMWPWEKITLNCFSLSNQRSLHVCGIQSSVAGMYMGGWYVYVWVASSPGQGAPVPSSIQARSVGIFWPRRQFLPH